MPALPPFPTLSSPAGLLESRPDLRAFRSRLKGSNYEIAAAVADQLPHFDIGFSYGFSAASVAHLLDAITTNVFANLAMPFFDVGKREAQVEERKRASSEIHNLFTDAFLVALQDVENAITAEQFQRQLLDRLDEEMSNARAALKQSRERYVHGLTSYLDVVLALQAVQSLERRLVSEQRDLLLARNQLYLALGGNWTKKLPLNGGTL